MIQRVIGMAMIRLRMRRYCTRKQRSVMIRYQSRSAWWTDSKGKEWAQEVGPTVHSCPRKGNKVQGKYTTTGNGTKGVGISLGRVVR